MDDDDDDDMRYVDDLRKEKRKMLIFFKSVPFFWEKKQDPIRLYILIIHKQRHCAPSHTLRSITHRADKSRYDDAPPTLILTNISHYIDHQLKYVVM